MNKNILIIIVLAICMIMPQTAMAQDVTKNESQKTLVDQELNAVTITANESTVQIKNAASQVLEVFNLAGVKIASIKIDSDCKTITFNDLTKGCYILKVGKTVRKVYIK